MRSSTQNKKSGAFISLKIAGHLGEVERRHAPRRYVESSNKKGKMEGTRVKSELLLFYEREVFLRK